MHVWSRRRVAGIRRRRPDGRGGWSWRSYAREKGAGGREREAWGREEARGSRHSCREHPRPGMGARQ